MFGSMVFTIWFGFDENSEITIRTVLLVFDNEWNPNTTTMSRAMWVRAWGNYTMEQDGQPKSSLLSENYSESIQIRFEKKIHNSHKQCVVHTSSAKAPKAAFSSIYIYDVDRNVYVAILLCAHGVDLQGDIGLTNIKSRKNKLAITRHASFESHYYLFLFTCRTMNGTFAAHPCSRLIWRRATREAK